MPEISALPSYSVGSLVSDFGDWMAPFIEIGSTEGSFPSLWVKGRRGGLKKLFIFETSTNELLNVQAWSLEEKVRTRVRNGQDMMKAEP